MGYTGNYVRCYVKDAEIGKMISVKITERYLDGAKAVPAARE